MGANKLEGFNQPDIRGTSGQLKAMGKRWFEEGSWIKELP
jgi:hypothetical protein